MARIDVQQCRRNIMAGGKNKQLCDFLDMIKYQFEQYREKTEVQYDNLTGCDPALSLELTERQHGEYAGRISTWEAALSLISQIEEKI